MAAPVGYDGILATGAFSLSESGLIAYRSSIATPRQLEWFDRTGKLLGAIATPDESDLADPEISPDGRRIAVDRAVQNNIDVWFIDNVRTTRFTFNAAQDGLAVWSPDGKRIVFRNQDKGVLDLHEKSANGSGNDTSVLESSRNKNPLSFSPDGRFLLYSSRDPKTGSDLWVLPLEGDRKPIIFANTPFDEVMAQFSPNGLWVAYQSNESGRNEIYVRPFTGTCGRVQASTGGGTQPRWRGDGKELYYIAPDGKLTAVPMAVENGALEAGAPVALFQTRMPTTATMGYRQQYDVAPDGRFLINTIAQGSTVLPITLLQNWKPPTE